VEVLLLGTGVYPIPPTGYGGVERTIAELAGALRGAGASVTILQEVHRERSTDEFRFARRLPSLLRGARYDVLHASTPIVANRLRWMRRPYVYTSHSRHWFLRTGLRGRWGYFVERRAVVGSRATIALSEPVQAAMAASLGRRMPALCPVIPIGVDAERFRPNPAARTGRRFLGVGVVERFKRWHIATRALAGLECELTLVGPTPNPAYAEELRGAGAHVRLAGTVSEDELTRLFAECDVLVHPSQVELIAGVVLQGLAAGMPVLGASAVGGLLEDGTTGFVVPEDGGEPAMIAGFRARAESLLGDAALRQRMAIAARASALRRFAWPAVAQAHLSAYAASLPGPGH
jgi:glycosyltransferase involved in cell wall biosynthesis